MRLRALNTAPWRRAPVLLLRARGTALAVAGAAVVVTFVAAAWPLFRASVEDASRQRQLDGRCPWELGATVVPDASFGSPANADRATQLAAFEASTAEVGASTPGLGPLVTTVATLAEVDLDGGARLVQLLSRTGASDAVEVVAGASDGSGALVPAPWADEVGVAAGGDLVLRTGGRTATVPLVATYRPVTDPLPDAWCSQRDRILPSGYGADPPPALVLLDRATFDEVVDALAAPVEPTWELPLADGLDGDGVEALAVALPGVAVAVEEGAGARLGGDATGALRAVTSTLPFIVDRSEEVARDLASGLVPTVVGAAVAGAVLVVATGWSWQERRAGEVAVLRRLGAPPGAVALKALLELALPVLAGTVAGAAAAAAAVSVVGPGGVPDVDALVAAARWATAAGAAGLVAAAAVAGVRSALADRGRVPTRTTPGRRLLRFVPVEVGAVLAVVAAGGGRRSLDVGGDRLDLDGISFALPVAVIVAGGVLAARLLLVSLAVAARRGDRLPTPLWLALRRLAGAPTVPAVFTALVVTAAGTVVYTSAASGSLDRSLRDKATLAVGADALVRTVGNEPPPAGLDTGVSPVATIDGAQRSDPDVVLLGVEPATAGEVVAHPGIGQDRLASLLDQLGRPGRAVPALLVGGPGPEGDVIVLAERGGVEVALEVVARLDRFPGMSQSRPTVVIDIERLRTLGVPFSEGLWVRGDPAPVVADLAAAGRGVSSVRVPDQALDSAPFLAVIWTFGFLRALAVLGALVAAVALLVQLDVRQRSRQLAAGLARLMGLAREEHRRSLVVELVAVVVPAAVAGAAVGLLTAAAFVPALDPLARFEPPTTTVVPLVALAAVLVCAPPLCALGATVGQRAADRVRLADALRHGG